MDNANFVPLGDGNRMLKPVRKANTEGAVSSLSHEGTQEKATGKSKEDRKRIAREYRLAARKEKKKFKSDAKKQRKENAVQHRRLTRNNEKYVKNKDRNKQRAIDMERNKIRYDAVHQAERLAAKHDMTGKLFNVGEVVIMEDGKVKSKAALQRIAEEKAQREAAAKAKAEGRAADGIVEGVNVQRLGQVPGLEAERPKRISNKQKKRQEMLAPKVVPPKPVIPEGYSLPEGEENVIALWDITDEEILRRLGNQKKEKIMAAKALRCAQQEKKKLNRAIKAMKKEADNKGILWDPIAARKEVLGEVKYLLPKQKKKKAAKEDGSDSDSDSSDSDSSSESEDSSGEWEDEAVPKPEIEEILQQGGVDEKGNAIFTENFANRPKLNLRLLKVAEDNERQLADRKRQAKLRRKVEAKKKAVEDAAALERQVADDKNARKAARRAARKEAEANGEVVEAPVVEEISEAQKAINKAQKSAAKKAEKAACKAAAVSAEETSEGMEGVESTGSDNKKRKRSEDVEDESETKQSKKSKQVLIESNDSKLDALIAEQNKARLENGEEADPVPQYAEYEISAHIKNNPISKKSKKRKGEVAAWDEEAEEKQRKKEKKARKAAEREAKAIASTASTTNGNSNGTAEQWNPEALTGDAARKEKYLRLLGAKKGSVAVPSSAEEKKRKKESNGTGKVEEIRKAESELERQFEAGIKLKHDGGGKRRGLGA